MTCGPPLYGIFLGRIVLQYGRGGGARNCFRSIPAIPCDAESSPIRPFRLWLLPHLPCALWSRGTPERVSRESPGALSPGVGRPQETVTLETPRDSGPGATGRLPEGAGGVTSLWTLSIYFLERDSMPRTRERSTKSQCL